MVNELKHFHVAEGSMLPDVMHDLLEGLLPYEAKLLLQQMINGEKYFKLDVLNDASESMELGYMESSNCPTPIEYTSLISDGHSLKQNGKLETFITCTHCYE